MTLTRDQINQLRRALQAGYAAFQAKEFDQAQHQALQVLHLDAGAVEGHYLIALIAIERGQWSVARKALGSVLSLDSRHAAAWVRLARVLVTTGEHADAMTSADNALQLGLKDAFDLDMAGAVYAQIGDQEKALTAFDQALDLDPNRAVTHLNKASSLTFVGAKEAAIQSLHRCLDHDPKNAKAHWMLARSQKAVNRDHSDQMAALLDQATHAQSIAMLGYGLGKELEDLGDWAAAFDAYQRGAAAKKSLMPYDSAQEERDFHRLMTTQTADWIKAQHSADSPQDAPIFIIGQPRSGTTLTERIIAAHSQVTAAGELQFAGLVLRRAEKQNPRPSAADLGHAYLAEAAPLRGNTPRFIDKLPDNFRHTGWLAAMFPKARFIHLTRHPMDSCFAVYKQLFAAAYPYSYDLKDLAGHYARYQQVMDHFERALPDRLLTISYEQLVQETEATTHQLLTFLGLPFEEACLTPHKTEGVVATASALQVREATHTRSVGLWQKFEKQLQPLYTHLNSFGVKGL